LNPLSGLIGPLKKAANSWLKDGLRMLNLDIAIFRAINGSRHIPWLNEVMVLLSDREVWFVVAAVVLFLCLVRFGWRKTLGPAFVLGTALGISDLITFRILKQTFERMRPCITLPDVTLLADSCGSDFSFPSNHAANAAALVAVVVCVFGWRRSLPIIVLGLLVGLSRIYLGVHYPSDVAFGFLTGSIYGLGWWWFVQRFWPSLLKPQQF
jgi:undecaprenyl-diphosphatase